MTAPTQTPADLTSAAIELDESHGAHNYHPLPVVLASGEGAWVTDVEGRRYLDFLSAYSALNFGHRHPALVAAAQRALGTLTLTSRAVHAEGFGGFARDLADLCGMEMVLPMNTGAEGVETAIKTARKWGYDVKGVEAGKAKIIVCEGNFHGRTTTIVSFSSDATARTGFEPHTPGFVSIPYGDAAALAEAIHDPDVVGFLFEPVQGEAGVVVPPTGYLRHVRDLCDKHGVLMIADEIQTGLCRTGRTFACEHEDVRPDIYILGKALGGGILPVSAVIADRRVLGVLTSGTHGSTFGGNPLACAVASAVIGLVRTGEYQERSRALGESLHRRLREEAPDQVEAVRGIGLWAGVQLRPEAGPARVYCERMLDRGVIVKDTHVTTLRLAPPLCIEPRDLDDALDSLFETVSAR